ncbi:hypothetical protein NM688_g4293 [Phlebia brevispora]|uniref:Uncharacterized protein n=1 Tax=Phlebia brevispora TaxID=194682 RepID=A0ACC1T3I1_9APHY|nr:hypothetical protein NM688_g4293 [Phlebia brevispora]
MSTTPPGSTPKWEAELEAKIPLPTDEEHHVTSGLQSTTAASSGSRMSRARTALFTLFLVALCILMVWYEPKHRKSKYPTSSPFAQKWRGTGEMEPFYSVVTTHGPDSTLCPGMYASGGAVSHSGFVGLQGDSEDTPRRIFFWFFEAQNGDPDAPVILTIGGGPGTSGMLNPLIGQSHCRITANGTEPNPNAWTERYNLLALDYPINAGLSYGTPPYVNNSRAAAYDAGVRYDLLTAYVMNLTNTRTHLPRARNRLVLASGSYGGTYIPHIATVIHDQNILVRNMVDIAQDYDGRALSLYRLVPDRNGGLPLQGARHVNLESMMVSNPYSDILHHYRWALVQRCQTGLFNASLCAQFNAALPACLEAIQVAYEAVQDADAQCRFRKDYGLDEFGIPRYHVEQPERMWDVGVPTVNNASGLVRPDEDAEILDSGSMGPIAGFERLAMTKSSRDRDAARTSFAGEGMDAEWSVRALKHTASKACYKTELMMLDNGRAYENVRWRCDGTLEDCMPEVVWVTDFFANASTRAALGVPDHVHFTAVSQDIYLAFLEEGDLRLTDCDGPTPDYVGREDANCAWPGIIAFLELLRTPYRHAFNAAPDVPWATSPDELKDVTTGANEEGHVDASGEYAGGLGGRLRTKTKKGAQRERKKRERETWPLDDDRTVITESDVEQSPLRRGPATSIDDNSSEGSRQDPEGGDHCSHCSGSVALSTHDDQGALTNLYRDRRASSAL